MADPIYLTHETTSVSATSPLGPSVSFTGTISGVRVLMPNGNLSGETQTFDLYKNGSALSTGLLVPDGENEHTVSGLSEAATDDDVFQFYITAPVADSMPVPPYNFTIVLAETHVDLTTAQTVAGVKTFSSSPIVPTPSGSTDAANKAYVDSSVAGLSWKQSVRVATAAAGTLASDFDNGSTVDGVSIATGDRILIKDQASATENGIYIVAASGAPTRATDADTGAEIVNASVYTSEGTANADKQFVCTTNSPITIGATNIVFAEFSSGSGMADLVDDTSPQLGGNLDLNSFTVGDASAADLTKLSEVTATSTELNYVDGVTSAIQTQLDAKQATLVSGTNIKTVNGSTLLGAGDLVVSGGGAGTFNIDDGTAAIAGTFTFDDGDATN